MQHIHQQHKGGAQILISSVGALHLKLHSVHSRPKGDKWQVNTANGLSLHWSAAHFSSHNNNAGGESFLSGLLVREWLGEEIGPVIILSSTCPSCRVPPSLTHWRNRPLNPDETAAQQWLAYQSCGHHCYKWLFLVEHWIWHWGIGNYWNFNHAVNIRQAASCMKPPICKNKWIKHCFHMGFRLMGAISVNRLWKVLCTESFSEPQQCHFIRQSKHNVNIQKH